MLNTKRNLSEQRFSCVILIMCVCVYNKAQKRSEYVLHTREMLVRLCFRVARACPTYIKTIEGNFSVRSEQRVVLFSYMRAYIINTKRILDIHVDLFFATPSERPVQNIIA